MRLLLRLWVCSLCVLPACTGTITAELDSDHQDAARSERDAALFDVGFAGDTQLIDDARLVDARSAESDTASPALDYRPDDGPEAGGGRLVVVRTAAELVAAIASANPGDEITLADGTYALDGVVAVTRPGTAEQRIFVRAENPRQATITVCADIGFRIDAPFWIFENLVLRSRCTSVSDHAFQVIGRGSDFILRHNRSEDFFAHVKLNGTEGRWPDRFWAIDNDFRDTMPIPADGPFNVLNIDGGNSHVVRGNRFSDIAVSTARLKHLSQGGHARRDHRREYGRLSPHAHLDRPDTWHLGR